MLVIDNLSTSAGRLDEIGKTEYTYGEALDLTYRIITLMKTN